MSLDLKSLYNFKYVWSAFLALNNERTVFVLAKVEGNLNFPCHDLCYFNTYMKKMFYFYVSGLVHVHSRWTSEVGWLV